MARLIHPEICPAVIAQFQCPMDPQREFLQHAGLLARKSRRKDLLGAARLVFALIVEYLRALWDNFTDSERAFTQNSDGKFAAGHKAFQHHLIIVPIRFRDSRLKVCGAASRQSNRPSNPVYSV